LPVVIAHNKAGVQFFDRPGRPEVAAWHDRILLRRKPYGHGSGARTTPTATDRDSPLASGKFFYAGTPRWRATWRLQCAATVP
jgi:hypothetical protein